MCLWLAMLQIPPYEAGSLVCNPTQKVTGHLKNCDLSVALACTEYQQRRGVIP